MSGGPDPLYVRARTALLDAADALAEQLDTLVLVAPSLHAYNTCFRLPFQAYPQAPRTLAERPFPALKNVTHRLSNGGVV